jgi:FkbM family methyltransferase
MVRELVRREMTEWDIGANVGLFSFAAASLGAQVVAVEADIWLANLMQRSALLNKLPVTVIPAAVSDQQGIFQALPFSCRKSLKLADRQWPCADCCYRYAGLATWSLCRSPSPKNRC